MIVHYDLLYFDLRRPLKEWPDCGEKDAKRDLLRVLNARADKLERDE